ASQLGVASSRWTVIASVSGLLVVAGPRTGLLARRVGVDKPLQAGRELLDPLQKPPALRPDRVGVGPQRAQLVLGPATELLEPLFFPRAALLRLRSRAL